jgi:hypothetical protein
VIEQRQHGRGVFLGKSRQFLEIFARVDDDAPGVGIHEIAQHALAERQLLIKVGRRPGESRLVANITPGFAQVGDVGGEFTHRWHFRPWSER